MQKKLSILSRYKEKLPICDKNKTERVGLWNLCQLFECLFFTKILNQKLQNDKWTCLLAPHIHNMTIIFDPKIKEFFILFSAGRISS